MDPFERLSGAIGAWQHAPGGTSDVGKRHHEWIKDLIEAIVTLRRDNEQKNVALVALTERCTDLEHQVSRLTKRDNRNLELDSGVGFTYSEAVTGNKRVTEAEVVLLARVAREAKQRESLENNIVVSGLPES